MREREIEKKGRNVNVIKKWEGKGRHFFILFSHFLSYLSLSLSFSFIFLLSLSSLSSFDLSFDFVCRFCENEGVFDGC